jgi:ribonuclease J
VREPAPLEVRIHGGAHEIGGNCVELRHGHGTLILDIGKPLTAGFDTVVPLPAAIGLGDNGTGPLGVIISHGHQDHWVPFTLGPFTITPYLADHSAYDAFSLLIQAGGRSLFYTGDIRGHGRKASAFEQFLAEPPSPVNAILMEGTSFRASDPDVDAEAGASELAPEVSPEYVTLRESDVEVELADTLKATSGLVVVLASAQNIDRLVTVYRAALRADRDLVVDLYTADITAATGRPSIPTIGADWPRVHVYAPLRQRVRVKESGQFERVERVRDRRLYPEQLRERVGRLVLFGAYQSEIPALIRDGLLTGGAVIWSMWDGYLGQTGGQRLQSALKAMHVPLIQHHTSGHATPADLARLVHALRPDVVVPIHTEAPDAYATTVGDIVESHADGTWWAV